MELTGAASPSAAASLHPSASHPAFASPGGGVQAWSEPRKQPAPAPAPPASTLGLLASLSAHARAALLLTSALLLAGAVVLGLHLGGRLAPASGAPGAGADLAAAALGGALPNSVTFIALGDWGREGNAAQRLPVPAMAAWAGKLKAANKLTFILSVGDNCAWVGFCGRWLLCGRSPGAANGHWSAGQQLISLTFTRTAPLPLPLASL
jgi:hypothetical protein